MNAYSETDQIKEWHKKPNKKAFIGFDEQTQAAVIAVLARENPKEAARFLRQLSSQQRQAAFRNIPREDWCGIAESLVPIKQEIKPSKIPWWSSLRALGNFPLFKVSYVALLVLPWVSRIAEYLKAGGDT